MKRMLICAALLGACMQETDVGPLAGLPPVTLPVADQAGNRMEALMQDADQRWCTGDNAWCVDLENHVVRFIGSEAEQSNVFDVFDLDSGSQHEVWPNIIRQTDGAVVVGLIGRQSHMYSGGGAEVSELRLYSIANGALQEAGVLPYNSAISTRACFDEEDQRVRRGACVNQYDFLTRISLNEVITRGPAQILLETAATTYPGLLNRNEDSTEAPPLQTSDLVQWVDPACSYRRTYIMGADGRYAPDQPLPDCSQYLEP